MINKQRLDERIQSLAEIGQTVDGGVTRLALTSEYREGLNLVKSWMEKAGMEVRLDQTGNLIGCKEGRYSDLKAIAIGSHIDSVGNGGKYDGTIGVLGGIEVVQHLYEENISHERSIEVIAFCEEEGSRFQAGGVYGSRAMVGKIGKEDLKVKDENGISRYEALKQFGLDPDNIKSAIRRKDELDLYLEMHVEQGPILLNQDAPVGIVTGITGLSLIEITLEGESNHVGATPMDMRNDALLGASEVNLSVEQIVNHYGGNAVGTVATLDVYPGQVNIIPGKTVLNIDVRDLDVDRRENILHEIENSVQKVCRERGLTYNIATKLKAKPALSSNEVIGVMKEESEKLNIKSYEMPSGGGHDAQLMNEITDIGMIFVRSENGSHNPNEYASIEDITQGTELLSNVTLQFLNK